MKKITSSLFTCVLVALALSFIGGDGCMYDTSKIANCKYDGASGDCETASDTVADDLCVDEDVQSAYQIALDCKAWDSGTQDCWVACVEQASNCSAAIDCDSQCDGC